jgi:hypothetical protein
MDADELEFLSRAIMNNPAARRVIFAAAHAWRRRGGRIVCWVSSGPPLQGAIMAAEDCPKHDPGVYHIMFRAEGCELCCECTCAVQQAKRAYRKTAIRLEDGNVIRFAETAEDDITLRLCLRQ